MTRMISQFLTASANSRTLDGPDAVQGGVKIIQTKTSLDQSDGIQILKRPSKKRY